MVNQYTRLYSFVYTVFENLRKHEINTKDQFNIIDTENCIWMSKLLLNFLNMWEAGVGGLIKERLYQFLDTNAICGFDSFITL